MKKGKTYWDEIKNNENRYSYMGWEVKLCKKPTRKYNPITGEFTEKITLEIEWPFRSGDGLSAKEKSEIKNGVKEIRKIEKILASSSSNYNEYLQLQQRVSREDYKTIIELYDGGLKGFNLRNHIQNQFLTEDEAHSLFYRM
jgi:hypothetical protein